MEKGLLRDKCRKYLYVLCSQISERCVGSEGNRQATSFLGKEFSSFGWKTEMLSLLTRIARRTLREHGLLPVCHLVNRNYNHSLSIDFPG